MTGLLRKRYTALLRCYPAADRAGRGAEIVETYVDLAPPGQRWPRAGDVADVLTGGLRRHLRLRNALGLIEALPVAGALALMMAAVLAGIWLVKTEGAGAAEYLGPPVLGPFHTLGVLAWVAWLLAPLAALAGLGRWAVGGALVVTVGVALAGAVVPPLELSAVHPPLFLLAPQIGLGLLALAADHRRGLRDTAVVVAPAAAAAGLTVLVSVDHQVGHEALPVAALILVLAVTALGVAFTVRRDRRAWWPAALFAGPVLLLGLGLDPGWGYSFESRKVVVAWTAGSLIAAVAVLLSAVQGRGRQTRRRAALRLNRLAERAAAEGDGGGRLLDPRG